MELNCMKGYSSFTNDQMQTIGSGTDDELVVYGYCKQPWKQWASQLATIFSLGLWKLILRWKPDWKAHLTFKPSPLQNATYLLLHDSRGQWSLIPVEESERLPSTPSELHSHQDNSNSTERSPLTSTVRLGNRLRFFEYQFLKYVWNAHEKIFKCLRGYDHGTICSDFFDKLHGLDESQQRDKLKLYGPNSMDIKVKSYGSLFIDEVLNPFYLFQIASITLWCLDVYYYYASCIFVISLVSIAISLYETKKQMKTLKDMISRANPHTVTIQRFGRDVVEEIAAIDVVPGDVLIIPANGCLMACDAVLTTGNCIVNESMLTGESVPDTKTPIIKCSEAFSIEKHKRNVLFCGTQVIQTRYYGNTNVTATVIRTGFSTAKGELVRSILFPKPMGFHFYRDSMRFVLILLGLALCGTAYSLYLYISRKAPVGETVKKALDIITIVVPPALPAALTVGTVYAQSRLKAKGIFCISPPRLNIAGKLKLVCFDKTGTLTEEGLDLWGVVPVHNAKFESVLRDEPTGLDERHPILLAMSTCHTLTSIDGELAGDPIDLKMFLSTKWVLEEFGKDTTRFDMLMPSVVRPPRTQDYWALSEESPKQESYVDGCISSKSVANSENEISHVLPPSNEKPLPLEVGIVRQFPFSSSLQLMSVICRTLGATHMDLYVKGAPEKISSLCLPHTIPENFNHMLQSYTLQGFRVLALAHKPLTPKLSWHQAQRIKREKVECDLIIVGLLVMQNSLKRETSPIISTLHSAKVRMVMVTGDNILTAMSVGRDCGLIPAHQQVLLVKAEDNQISFQLAETSVALKDPTPTTSINMDPLESHLLIMESSKNYCLAVDGKSFAALRLNFPSIFKRVLVKGAIFARMSPDEKTVLVESLQELGFVVAMCGDGANDCGALKAADVGISLSEAEASVAAPFTSRIPNIQCVPIVMREGRCALVTSFALFKFIALYSIIQFVSVLILYSKGSNLSDAMFLYIDLALITTLAIVMGNTKAHEKLVKERPLSNLVNFSNVVSMLLQVILVSAVQAVTLFFLTSRPWYRPQTIDPEKIIFICLESSSIFLVSCFQYLIVAIVFSRGPPYRRPSYTNVWYLSAMMILVGFTCLLLFTPWPQLGHTFQLVDWNQYPNHLFYFRLTLLLIAVGNLILAVAAELLVARSDWLKQVSRWLRGKTSPKNLYKKLESTMNQDVQWPPTNSLLVADLPEENS